MTALRVVRRFGALIGAVALAACSNGRGNVEEGQQQTSGTFTVGGAVSGLAGSGLVLQLNGAGDLTVSSNGAFTFATGLADGAAYDVTIRSQPTNPAQTCAVSSGAGRIATANVSNVAVLCSEGGASFSVGGTVTGLTGSGLILRNNGVEDLPISADGEFIFPTPVATGASYSVRVAASPSNPAQTCTIENGEGVMGASDVTNVRVVCSVSAYTIGGTVTGLTGSGLLLRLNGAEDLGVGADGQFTFLTRVASGAQYSVTVERQPTGQSCSIPNGQGTVGQANVTDIAVTCGVNAYPIGGEVSGLAQTPNASVTLRLTAGSITSEHIIRANGAFEFPVAVPNGVGYAIAVASHPTQPSQVCEVTNGSGIVIGAPVTNVRVACTTQRFTIGGSVSGLAPASSGLTLRLTANQASDDLPIAANGTFVFDRQVESGSRYTVAVVANPTSPPQTCTPSANTGVVGGQNVRNVAITCALNTYAISVNVSGLTPGTRLILVNNGSDTIEVTADGGAAFPTRIATGGAYNVTVGTPAPAGHTCSVASGSGTVGASDVTVAVSCQPVYTIGGSVSGLTGSGLVLRNGDATLAVGANAASFQFTQTFTTGATYNVVIDAQPTSPSQTCSVANGAGTVGNANVTNIAITCTTNSFTVGGAVNNLQGFNLQLQNNGGDTLTINSNGGFTFATPVASGQPYSVIVSRQPDPLPFLPSQTCTVANGAGVVGAAAVGDIVVTCQ